MWPWFGRGQGAEINYYLLRCEWHARVFRMGREALAGAPQARAKPVKVLGAGQEMGQGSEALGGLGG